MQEQTSLAYSLSQIETGWRWSVYDEDGVVVARGADASRDVAQACVERTLSCATAIRGARQPGLRPCRHGRPGLRIAVLNLFRRIESRALILVIALSGALWALLQHRQRNGRGRDRGARPTHSPGAAQSRRPQRPDRLALLRGGDARRDRARRLHGGDPGHPGGGAAFLIHGRKRHALVLAGTVILAEISSDLAKTLYARPRPDLVPHGTYVYSASFPSGHSTLSAATYLTLAVLIASLEPNRGTKAMVFVLAAAMVLAIGFSRVYLGVHWPSDVLAGWSLGAAWALAGWSVLRRIVRRPLPG